MTLFSLDHFLLPFAFFVVSLCIIWFVWKQIEFYVWKIPPGPIGFPLLGYVQIWNKEIHKDLAHLNQRYGKVCSYTIASLRVVTVSDYDTAKELLNHPAALSRPNHVFNFFPGNAGFVSMDGKQWALERRFVLQALKDVGLGKELWDDYVREDVMNFVNCITEKMGKAVDVTEELSLSAIMNITALTMGRRFVNDMTKDELIGVRDGVVAAKEHFGAFIITVGFPWLQKYFMKFNIRGFVERSRKIGEISDIFRNEIRKRFNSDAVQHDSRDFIKHYQVLAMKKNSHETNEISAEFLLGNMESFSFATDTAMLGTLWILYIMAALPEKQAQVHTEMDEATARDVTISWEDRKKTPYTLACVLEMLRWVAVSPLFPPRCTTETFEFHGYSIPKGTWILTNGWAVSRDPKYWDHPDEYMPERFLNRNVETFSKMEGFAPFSFGKRNCPCERIATMIIYLYFVGIMQKFEVRTPSGKPPDLKPQFNGVFQPKPQELCFIERN